MYVPLWEEVDYAQFWRDIREKDSLRAIVEVIHRISYLLHTSLCQIHKNWLARAVRKKDKNFDVRTSMSGTVLHIHLSPNFLAECYNVGVIHFGEA